MKWCKKVLIYIYKNNGANAFLMHLGLGGYMTRLEFRGQLACERCMGTCKRWTVWVRFFSSRSNARLQRTFKNRCLCAVPDNPMVRVETYAMCGTSDDVFLYQGRIISQGLFSFVMVAAECTCIFS